MKSLIKFSAAWCGPCKNLTASMAYANLGGIKVEKIDVDNEATKSVVEKYGIRSVPTLILLEDGVEVKRTSGSMTAPELESWVS